MQALSLCGNNMSVWPWVTNVLPWFRRLVGSLYFRGKRRQGLQHKCAHLFCEPKALGISWIIKEYTDGGLFICFCKLLFVCLFSTQDAVFANQALGFFYSLLFFSSARTYNNCKYICTQHWSTYIYIENISRSEGRDNCNTIIAGDYNTSVSQWVDHLDRKSIKTYQTNYILDQMDLADIYI